MTAEADRTPKNHRKTVREMQFFEKKRFSHLKLRIGGLY